LETIAAYTKGGGEALGNFLQDEMLLKEPSKGLRTAMGTIAVAASIRAIELMIGIASANFPFP
jgi:hypothetical protein